MTDRCIFCNKTDTTIYPVLNIHVCGKCFKTLDRLGGVQLSRVQDSVTPEIKSRFINAVKLRIKSKERMVANGDIENSIQNSEKEKVSCCQHQPETRKKAKFSFILQIFNQRKYS